jgi:uncharacterized membrane protein YqaE (UPF0057 family)
MLVVSHDHYELTFFFSPLFDVTRHRQPHQQPYRHVQEHRQVLVSFFSVFLTEGFLSILVDFGLTLLNYLLNYIFSALGIPSANALAQP